MHKLYTILLLATFFLCSNTLTGQKMVNSPYSRFGPGVIEQQGLFKTRSMGGAAIGLRDPVTINYLNPASYSSIDTNSFVFDFGIEYQANFLGSSNSSHFSDDYSFHHLAMAFPVTKWLGFATGIVPYSNGYYNLETTVSEGDPGYDPVIGEYRDAHKGTGSYNTYFAGLGISPVKNLSLGVNFTYLFGNIERDNLYAFTGDNNQFSNLSTEDIRLYGYNLEYGLQYITHFNNDYFASIGASYTAKKSYNSEYNKLSTKYSPYQESEYSTDTLDYISDKEGSIEMPEKMGVGISFGKKDLFLITADYTKTQWDDISFTGYEDNLTNSSSIRAGIQFIPDIDANYNYLNRVEYRLGGHISDSHLMVNGEQLKEFGITFGAGLPMNRSKSRVNLHIGYLNRKGSSGNGLHTENLISVGLSLDLYDYWFFKQKYK